MNNKGLEIPPCPSTPEIQVTSSSCRKYYFSLLLFLSFFNYLQNPGYKKMKKKNKGINKITEFNPILSPQETK